MTPGTPGTETDGPDPLADGTSERLGLIETEGVTPGTPGSEADPEPDTPTPGAELEPVWPEAEAGTDSEAEGPDPLAEGTSERLTLTETEGVAPGTPGTEADPEPDTPTPGTELGPV